MSDKAKYSSYPYNLSTCSLVGHVFRFKFSAHPVRKGAIILSIRLQQSSVFWEKYNYFQHHDQIGISDSGGFRK